MSKATVARVYRVYDGSALVTNMSSSSPANGGSIQFEAITDFDPVADEETRYVLIDAEIVSYTDINEDTDELLNITRAALSTTAAAHTPGTFAYAGTSAKSRKFADAYIDDDDSLNEGIEILWHLQRFFRVGDRDHDAMELVSVRYLDDGHPIIVDAPETDEEEPDPAQSPVVFWWSRHGRITTGVKEHLAAAPFGGQAEEVRVTLGDNGTADATVTVDILKNGASILTTKPTITAGQTISAAIEPTDKPFTKGDTFQVEFEGAGSSDQPGRDPTVYLTTWPTEDASVGRIEVPGPTGLPGVISEVQNEGVALTDAPIMDFTGSAVTATSDGSKYTVAIAGGQLGDVLDIQFVRKASDESVTSSAVLQDDNELTLPIGASETWIYDFFIKYGSTSTTPDVQFAIGVPSGAAGLWGPPGLRYSTSGTAIPAYARPLGDANFDNFGTDGGTGHAFFIRVIVRNSTTAGNVVLRWCQNTSNGTATTVFADSYMIGMRVA